jgi:flavin-dependent dehydrogenase
VTDHDVVVVGARPAGASLALRLARAGLDVAVVERAALPAPTVSTHVIYPVTLALLDGLGVLDELEAAGAPPLATTWHHAGRSFSARHTPVGGRDGARCIRRTTLDPVILRAARAAGATVHVRFRVQELIGAGTPDDPVRGVGGIHGDRRVTLRAPLVVGADGTHSIVAARLGLERADVLSSPTFIAYAYWRDLPHAGAQEFFFTPPWVATHFPADGGRHVVMAIGPREAYPGFLRDPRAYRRAIDRHPLLRARLKAGRQESKTVGASRLDGYYRPATGPGWALIGDAGHFKHPTAVQGIHDALASAAALARSREDLERWRDTTRELYAFSRWTGAVPTDDGVAAVVDAASADPAFARDLIDVWGRARRPADVLARVAVPLAA